MSSFFEANEGGVDALIRVSQPVAQPARPVGGGGRRPAPRRDFHLSGGARLMILDVDRDRF